jgi:hypothetical protein
MYTTIAHRANDISATDCAGSKMLGKSQFLQYCAMEKHRSHFNTTSVQRFSAFVRNRRMRNPSDQPLPLRREP